MRLVDVGVVAIKQICQTHSRLKKSTGTSYLTSKSAQKSGSSPNSSGGNIKKSVKAATGFNHLIPGAKKAFNLLWHVFTQASIF